MVNKENVEIGQPDSFFRQIILIAGKTKGMTIPIDLVRGLNLEVGDTIKVWIKKVHNNE